MKAPVVAEPVLAGEVELVEVEEPVDGVPAPVDEAVLDADDVDEAELVLDGELVEVALVGASVLVALVLVEVGAPVEVLGELGGMMLVELSDDGLLVLDVDELDGESVEVALVGASVLGDVGTSVLVEEVGEVVLEADDVDESELVLELEGESVDVALVGASVLGEVGASVLVAGEVGASVEVVLVELCDGASDDVLLSDDDGEAVLLSEVVLEADDVDESELVLDGKSVEVELVLVLGDVDASVDVLADGSVPSVGSAGTLVSVVDADGSSVVVGDGSVVATSVDTSLMSIASANVSVVIEPELPSFSSPVIQPPLT